MRKNGIAASFCIFVVVGLFLISGCGKSDPKFQTEYQAVFLDNGQVFFGKVENAGSPYVLVRDCFYVQNQVMENKQVNSILIKRGKEWHEPENMYLNATHIVLIEPVSADSRVAQLIKESKKEKPTK